MKAINCYHEFMYGIYLFCRLNHTFTSDSNHFITRCCAFQNFPLYFFIHVHISFISRLWDCSIIICLTCIVLHAFLLCYWCALYSVSSVQELKNYGFAGFMKATNCYHEFMYEIYLSCRLSHTFTSDSNHVTTRCCAFYFIFYSCTYQFIFQAMGLFHYYSICNVF